MMDLSIPPQTSDRKVLRGFYRARRNALDPKFQSQSAIRLAYQFRQQSGFHCAQNIALYLANDGEISARPLIEMCWEQGKSVYLPVLHPFCKGYLLFVHYDDSTQMTQNRFGIPEPVSACHNVMPVNQLDMIVTPLVAFDSALNRLGMGGGFYDRSLAPVRRQESGVKVIGVAHDVQEAESLPFAPWDIPMDKIITPTQVISTQ